VGGCAVVRGGVTVAGPNNNNVFDINSLSNNPLFNLANKFANFDQREDYNINFNDFVNSSSNDSPYDLNNFYCEYSAIDNLRTPAGVRILSLNVQILLAKYQDCLELISTLHLNNNPPDIIALQEIWRIPTLIDFKIPNYAKAIFKCRKDAQGGGVKWAQLNCGSCPLPIP